MAPRLTQFDVTPDGPTSLASDRAKPAAAAFAAPYTAMPISPVRPASDTIVTTRPHPRSIIPPTTAWVTLSTPYRLRSTTGGYSDGSVSTKWRMCRPDGGTPAL